MGGGAVSPQATKQPSPSKQSSPSKQLQELRERRVEKSPTRNSVARSSMGNQSSTHLPEIYTLIDLPKVQESAGEARMTNKGERMIKIKSSRKIGFIPTEGKD